MITTNNENSNNNKNDNDNNKGPINDIGKSKYLVNTIDCLRDMPERFVEHVNASLSKFFEFRVAFLRHLYILSE